jgi:hypothetical protein
MGNTTRPKPNSPPGPGRNVQPIINRIRNRQTKLKNEANKLQTLYRNIGRRLEAGVFYESDYIRLEAIKRAVHELIQEKKDLERAFWAMLRYQIKHSG